MKKISLSVLNLCGTLLMSYKSSAFVRDGQVILYGGRPISCYLHFYNGEYVFTSFITSPFQRVYSFRDDAVTRFTDFISAVC